MMVLQAYQGKQFRRICACRNSIAYLYPVVSQNEAIHELGHRRHHFSKSCREPTNGFVLQKKKTLFWRTKKPERFCMSRMYVESEGKPVSVEKKLCAPFSASPPFFPLFSMCAKYVCSVQAARVTG
jgi:hypothetical protein